jgi:hypothetical protein
MIKGGCACGAVTYESDRDSVLSYKCHCSSCQASSGSGFVALLWVWESSFKYSSGSPVFSVTPGTSGKDVARGFCALCGAPVVTRLDVLPQILGIPATSLNDPTLFIPEYEVWTSSALPWDMLDPDIPHLEGNFTGEIIKQSLSKPSRT